MHSQQNYQQYGSGGDPLTDSGVHRFAMGTKVRLWLHGGEHVDCGLVDIQDVSTWTDVVLLVTKVMPIVVTGPRRHAFAAGVVLRAECISDPDPFAKQTNTL
jgi:hypothetical protein